MNQQLAIVKESVEYNQTQLAIIKETVAKGTSDAEFGLFVEVCKMTGLNPFARQIYAIVRGNKMTIQTGIDGYRVMAERTGKYAGQVGPFWCDEDGEWRDVWLKSTPPVACKVGVLRRDFAEPMWAVARTAAYKQDSNALWKTMPEVMIAKCAEALALRKAFPEQISGVYTAEEMAQADNSTPTIVNAAPAPSAPLPPAPRALEPDRIGLPLRNAQVLDLMVSLQRFTDADRRVEMASVIEAIESAGQPVTLATVKAELKARVADLETLSDANEAPASADLTDLPVGMRGN